MIGKTISHYRILQKLGEGGMGEVYKAEDTKLHRSVALKFLLPEMTRDVEAKNRFIQEARTASSLDHPNIAVVHDIDETDDGQSYICMAYYDGKTLKDVLKDGPMAPVDAIHVALQIANGLQRAHEAGIVHRDIKPANIIITPRGEVKIVDFGIAKLSAETRTTRYGATAGTAAYMSPEQAQGLHTDHRTDLFSLGVVLYEMVTGVRPFTGEHEPALLYSIVNVNPPLPSLVRPDLPTDLEEVILCLLSKLPEERYQSAAGLIEDLGKIVTGKKLGTGKWGVPVWRISAARKRILLSAGIAVIVLGILLLTVVPLKAVLVEPSEYVLVAEVQNRTGRSVFDYSLTEAMRVALRQSTRINVFPGERIREALTRMKTSSTRMLNDSLAVAVARREGIRIVVAADIVQLGETYTLSSRIIDAVSGETVRLLRRESVSPDRVLGSMDQLCEDVREALGESMERIETYRVPLEKVTTASLEALDLYSRGNTLEGEGKYAEAAVLKEQAVQIDSLFTIAISDLSYIHRKLGNDSLALYYHGRVLPLIDRVTDRERYYILALYYSPSFEFDFQKAFENIQQLVLRYPYSPEGYATLGHLAMFAGDYATAIDANQKSLAIDSVYAGTIFNNTGYAYALSGNWSEALDYFRKSKHIRPSYRAIDSYVAQAHWIGEQYDSVEVRLGQLVSVSDARRRVLSYSQLVSFLYFRGRLDAAKTRCQEAIAFCQANEKRGDESYFRFLMGDIRWDLNEKRAAVHDLMQAEHLSVSPFVELPLIGVRYARWNRINDAQRILDLIRTRRSGDPYFVKRRNDYLNLVEGEILLARKNHAEALNKFLSVTRLHSADPIFLLARRSVARCQEASGSQTEIETLRDLLNKRGEVVLGLVLAIRNSGPWIRELWPEVELRLAQVEMRQGNTKEAETYALKSLTCWESAQKDFQQAHQARQILETIRTAR